MAKVTKIRGGAILKQAQQGPSTTIPLQSVGIAQLTAGARLVLTPADAVVGTAGDVTAGNATHSSLNQAIIDVAAGSKIRLLRVTLSETVSVNKRVSIEGQGYDSQLNGAVTCTSACVFSTLRNLRFGTTLTLNAGANGNIVSQCFFATASTVVDGGSGNSIEGVVEA